MATGNSVGNELQIKNLKFALPEYEHIKRDSIQESLLTFIYIKFLFRS